MKRIQFSAWGHNGLEIPAYANKKENSDSADCVAEAIARKNSLKVCAGPKYEGGALENNIVTDHHYSASLGKPASGGGFNIVSPVWFSIPARAAS